MKNICKTCEKEFEYFPWDVDTQVNQCSECVVPTDDDELIAERPLPRYDDDGNRIDPYSIRGILLNVGRDITISIKRLDKRLDELFPAVKTTLQERTAAAIVHRCIKCDSIIDRPDSLLRGICLLCRDKEADDDEGVNCPRCGMYVQRATIEDGQCYVCRRGPRLDDDDVYCPKCTVPLQHFHKTNDVPAHWTCPTCLVGREFVLVPEQAPDDDAPTTSGFTVQDALDNIAAQSDAADLVSDGGDHNTDRDLDKRFLNAMREKMQEGRKKGKVGWDQQWQDCNWSTHPEGPLGLLMECLRHEVTELTIALHDGTHEDILKEAADVANFAMMVADFHGALDEPETLLGIPIDYVGVEGESVIGVDIGRSGGDGNCTVQGIRTADGHLHIESVDDESADPHNCRGCGMPLIYFPVDGYRWWLCSDTECAGWNPPPDSETPGVSMVDCTGCGDLINRSTAVETTGLCDTCRGDA